MLLEVWLAMHISNNTEEYNTKRYKWGNYTKRYTKRCNTKMCNQGNPFMYGEVVGGEHFINREKELKELADNIKSGKSVIIYSPRGMGKTSLVKEFFRRSGKSRIHVLIDMFGTESRDDLAREIVKGVAGSAYGTLDNIRKSLGGLLRGLRFDIVLTSTGDLRFEPSRSPTNEDLAEVFELAEKVAKKKDAQIVMAFDEFQEIGNLNGEALEKLMRSKFQHHKNVVYIFTGSRRHLLNEIFSEKRRAFYRFARPMELGPISNDEFSQYISTKFEKSGGRISKVAIDRVLSITGGHPSFTQQLCYELWFMSKKVDDESPVEEAVRSIITHEKRHYIKIWENVTLLQRRLLEGLAKEEIGPYSQEFISKYGLRSPANVRRGLELLEKRGLVEDGKIPDVFFREWVRRMLKVGLHERITQSVEVEVRDKEGKLVAKRGGG